MYALFLPSAHSFISSVEEKVKVEERIISVTIGPLTPRRFGSPPGVALVCGPGLCWDLFFMGKSVHLAGKQEQLPNWHRPRQFGWVEMERTDRCDCAFAYSLHRAPTPV